MPDFSGELDESIAFSYHVHANPSRGPYLGGRWCRSFDRKKGEVEYDPTTAYPKDLKEQALAYGRDHEHTPQDWTVGGPLGYGQDRCLYQTQLVALTAVNSQQESENTVAVAQYYHLHTADEPYCRAGSKPNAKANAEKKLAELGGEGEVVGPVTYGKADCPYLNDDEEEETVAEAESEEDDEPEEVVAEIESEEDDEPEEVVAEIESEEDDEPEDEEEDPEEDDEEESDDESEEEEENEAEFESVEEAEDEAPEPAPEPEPAPRRRKSAKAVAAEPAAAPTKQRKTKATAVAPTITVAPDPIVKDKSGQEIDLHELECSACSGTLDDHRCPSLKRKQGSTGRKAVQDRPVCPHCGGPAHWNDAGTKVNVDCLQRQMLLKTGVIATPYDRLPVFEAADFVNLGTWIRKEQKAGNTLSYGKMASADGTGGTYAAMRQQQMASAKAANVEPAAPGARIEDVTADGEDELEEPEEAPKPKRRTKAEKAASAAAVTPAVSEDKKAARKNALADKLKKGKKKAA